MDQETLVTLRQKYPHHVPLSIAGDLLGISPRQLSKLIAEGRRPFADLGADIGIRQRYIRIYTERLIAYLSGDCLRLLDTSRTRDVRTLSYTFRPLTKNKYVSKSKGIVTLLRKGKAMFPSTQPLITTGGGPNGITRTCTVSRVAAWLEREGIPSFAERLSEQENYFIPAPCWRRIRSGILSTTRFAGILFLGEHRLAVYDIGDGGMEWQLLNPSLTDLGWKGILVHNTRQHEWVI